MPKTECKCMDCKILGNDACPRARLEVQLAQSRERVNAVVVKLDTPCAGFNRELQILDNAGKVIHVSGTNHQQSDILTSFNGINFLAPSYGNKIYKEI